MAVPSYQRFAELISDSGSNLTIDKPSGVVETDLMIAVCVMEYRGDDVNFTPSAGWNEIVQITDSVSCGIFYKIAGVSEPNNYTFVADEADKSYSFIIRITGYDTLNPINISSSDTGTSAAPLCPSVTTTLDNCLVLRIFGADNNDITEDGGEPSGTTVITVKANTSFGCSGGGAYESQIAAGITGAAAFALTASQEWIAVTIAIPPPNAPTPNPMAFVSIVASEDGTSITMVASEATHDAENVEYYFTAVDGGNDSGWQASKTYVDNDLASDTSYKYTVTARTAITHVETAASEEETIYTFLQTRIACLGDPSDHGGTIITTNQDDTLLVAGVKVAVNGASHSCPIKDHGITSITAVTTKSYQNGKLILTAKAVAGCGAKLTPPDRKVYVE